MRQKKRSLPSRLFSKVSVLKIPGRRFSTKLENSLGDQMSNHKKQKKERKKKFLQRVLIAAVALGLIGAVFYSNAQMVSVIGSKLRSIISSSPDSSNKDIVAPEETPRRRISRQAMLIMAGYVLLGVAKFMARNSSESDISIEDPQYSISFRDVWSFLRKCWFTFRHHKYFIEFLAFIAHYGGVPLIYIGVNDDALAWVAYLGEFFFIGSWPLIGSVSIPKE